MNQDIKSNDLVYPWQGNDNFYENYKNFLNVTDLIKIKTSLLFGFEQDTVVLWSKSSTLDRKFQGSNPAAANFSFEVNDHWRVKHSRIWSKKQDH